MAFLQHLITPVALVLVLRWLWKSASRERATLESGRQVFRPTNAVRFLLILFAVLFAGLAVFAAFLLDKHGNWWVTYLFLGFFLLVLFSYPPVLTIEVEGVGSRSRFGNEKKLRWEDISSLQYNAGNRYFTVRALDGRKITHSGFNADADLFREEIQRRTRLPIKVAQPGLWKNETVEIPYDERDLREVDDIDDI